MEEKVSGIVLSAINYAENDKILTVFTLEQGVVSARIKGVKKAGAKLKFASEPFCFAQFIFSKKGKYRTVIGASLIESFYSLRESLDRFFAGGTVLEFVRKFLKEGATDPELFSLVIATLKDMAFSDNSVKYTLCAFLIKALALSGYALKLDGCFGCGCSKMDRVFFDYDFGGFFCQDCLTENCKEIRVSTLEDLIKIQKGQTVEDLTCIYPLKLLDYYLTKKTEEKINSLKELINMA